MIEKILLYAGSFLPFAWGIAHLFPTREIVKGFGNISQDNRRIITMEWIIEGVALIFVGILIAVVTYFDLAAAASLVVYLLSAVLMVALAIVSILTGAKIKFLPFKLCPVIFGVASLLIFLGAFL